MLLRNKFTFFEGTPSASKTKKKAKILPVKNGFFEAAYIIGGKSWAKAHGQHLFCPPPEGGGYLFFIISEA